MNLICENKEFVIVIPSCCATCNVMDIWITIVECRVCVLGANEVKVWDTLAGGKLLTTFTHHHKNIMDMCFCSDFQRIVTASLDKYVQYSYVTVCAGNHSTGFCEYIS